jgi:hypothetical protein
LNAHVSYDLGLRRASGLSSSPETSLGEAEMAVLESGDVMTGIPYIRRRDISG